MATINENESTIILSNNSYTNKNVKIGVNLNNSNEKGVFDSDVKLEISKNNSLIQSYNSFEQIKSNNIQIESEGTYSAKLYYGPTFNGEQNTFSQFTFTIDKTAPELRFKDTTTDNFEKIVYYITATNNSFKINYDSEDTSTKGNITYKYATISKLSEDVYTYNKENDVFTKENDTLTLNENFIYNGYKFNSLTNSLNYTADTEIKNDGLYIFTIKDIAGNETIRVIIKDSTTPYMLQNPNQDENNFYNLFTDDVKVWASAYKALDTTKLFSENNAIYNNEEWDNSIYGNNNFNKFFNDSKAFIIKLDNSSNIKNNDEVIMTGNQVLTLSGVTLEKPTDTINGVNIYEINLIDVIGNTQTYRVEINLDRSQGFIFATNNDNIQDEDRIDSGKLTNKSKLYFEFKLGEGEFEIDSLTLTYYPFAYDIESNYYPFSSVATINDYNLLVNKEISIRDENKYITAALNISGEETRPGYYVITRVFKYNENGAGTKKYTFIIDRNNIKDDMTYVDGDETYRWGENVKFTLGDDDYTTFVPNITHIHNFEYDETQYPLYDNGISKNNIIAQNFPTANLIETNKMPVILTVPKYKYNKVENDVNSNKLSVVFYTLKDSKLTITEIGNYKWNSDQYLFTDEGVYYVLIFDNAGNAMTFNFKITLNSPTGSWQTSSNNYFAEYATLEATENTVDFTFTNLNDITKAQIDTEKITIFKVIGNNRTAIYGSEYEIVSVTDNIKTTYTIKNLDASTNCVYELTIQYNGNKEDYKEYFSKTYYLIVDKTKPTFTLDTLINRDNYSLKENYYSGNSDLGYTVKEDYFFAVENGFIFTSSTEEYVAKKFPYYINNSSILPQLVKSETSKLYYREIKLFSEGEANLPSLLPTDANYSNYNIQRDRLRFNQYDSKYTNITYNHESNVFTSNKFYEIIEIDEAGNYNLFVIYVADTNNASISYTEDTDEEKTSTLPLENNIFENDNYVKKFNINNIYFGNEYINDLYYTVKITTGNNKQEEFNFDKSNFNLIYENNTQKFEIKNNNETINNIKNYISSFLNQEDIKENGGKITISVYSRIQSEILDFNFTIQGSKNLYISAISNNGNIRLIIDRDINNINNIKEIYIYGVKDGSKDTVALKEYSYYDFYQNVSDEDKYYLNTDLSINDIYVIEYIDVFNNKRVDLINNQFEDDSYEDRLHYNSEKSKTLNGVINTSESVTFTYQSNLYKLEVFKNNQIAVEGIDYVMSSKASDGRITLTFNKPQDYNTVNEYNIKISYLILDQTDSVKNYNFVINTRLPNIQLKDFISNILLDAEELTFNENNEPNKTLYTAQRTFINWDETVLDFNPVFTVYYNGAVINTNSNLTNARSYFNNIGSYTIIQTNELNNQRIIKFEITEDSNLFYWINNKSTGEKLSASKYLYKYIDEENNIEMEIPFYNTTLSYNEYEVVANVDKRLRLVNTASNNELDIENSKPGYVKNIQIENGVIYIYRIYGNETHVYDAYIAVATIAKVDRILTNNDFKINGSVSSENPYSYYGEEVRISWNAYHLIYCNPISAYVSLNGNEFTKITDYVDNQNGTYTFTIKNGGQYRFYFVDDAGNMNKFNINTPKESNYLTINLVNSIWLTIKSSEEQNYRNVINYEVFNNEVSIQIWGTEFIANGSLNYTATKNGEDVTLERNGNVLTATDVGLYCIELTAVENVSGLRNNIKTVIYFTIIDKDEARSLFDYSTANSQSIVKIERFINDNYVDITSEVLNYYLTSSLTHIFISNQSIGVGRYKLTVNDISNINIYGTQQFSYEIWINNEDPAFEISRDFGTSATSNITIKLNKGLIASQIGNCKLIISNYGTIDITTADTNAITPITLSSVGDYYISIVSTSGQVLFSNKITISKKLSNITIIVIVIVVILIAIGLFIFLKLRTKMRVR